MKIRGDGYLLHKKHGVAFFSKFSKISWKKRLKGVPPKTPSSCVGLWCWRYLTSLEMLFRSVGVSDPRNNLERASPKSIDDTWVQYCHRGCSWWIVTKSVKTSRAYKTNKLFQTTLKNEMCLKIIFTNWLFLLFRTTLKNKTFQIV